MTTTEPETTETTETREHVERWTYGGVRMTTDRKRTAMWIDPSGRELLFAAKASTRGAVGMVYNVTVVRPGGDRVSMIGAPVWTGEAHPDDEYRLRLAAAARAAEVRLAAVSAERRYEDELDQALEPLLAVARKMRAADRTALLAYVIRKIGGVW